MEQGRLSFDLVKVVRQPEPGPTIREQLDTALRILSQPPAREWISRPALRGVPKARFILPLELCVRSNVTSTAKFAKQGWRIGKIKRQLGELMLLQLGGRGFERPLDGRPQVIVVRFSPVEPDITSDWSKYPVDILCKRTAKHRNRLNIIEDDRPRCAEVLPRWEPIGRGLGFVFLEVRG